MTSGARPPTSGVRGAAAKRPRERRSLAAPDSRGRQYPHLLVVGSGNSFGRLRGEHGGGCGKSRWRSDFAPVAAAQGRGDRIPASQPGPDGQKFGNGVDNAACKCGAEKELPHKDGFHQQSAEDGCRDRSENSGSRTCGWLV